MLLKPLLSSSKRIKWDNIYTKELSQRLQCHPLLYYIGDCSGELMLIGDVGYIHEGEFHRLFNTMLEADHKINLTRLGVPDMYERFKVSFEHHNRHEDYLPAGPLCSANVYEDAGAHGACSDARDSEQIVSKKFQCEAGKSGAMILLKESATLEEIICLSEIELYIKKNYHHWLAYVREEFEEDAQDVELVFVQGVVRTAEWLSVIIPQMDTRRTFEIVRTSGTPSTYAVQGLNHSRISHHPPLKPLKEKDDKDHVQINYEDSDRTENSLGPPREGGGDIRQSAEESLDTFPDTFDFYESDDKVPLLGEKSPLIDVADPLDLHTPIIRHQCIALKLVKVKDIMRPQPVSARYCTESTNWLLVTGAGAH